jgi:Spy/CpxP family protein refolding chaperone
MKKILLCSLAVCACVLLSTAAFSQDRGPMGSGMNEGGMRHHGGMMGQHGKGFLWGDPERLQKILGLSDDQVDQIADLNEKMMKEHRAIMDKISPKGRELKKVLRAENVDLDKARALLKEIGEYQVESRMIMIRHRLELEKLLTADQRKKLRESRPDMAGPMMQGAGPNGPED